VLEVVVVAQTLIKQQFPLKHREVLAVAVLVVGHF
jgi:hypothetical protein